MHELLWYVISKEGHLIMKVSIDGEGTRFHFFISETKRDFD